MYRIEQRVLSTRLLSLRIVFHILFLRLSTFSAPFLYVPRSQESLNLIGGIDAEHNFRMSYNTIIISCINLVSHPSGFSRSLILPL